MSSPVNVTEVAAEPAKAVKEPLAGRKVLVVDDEEDIRTFLVTVFEDAGAEVDISGGRLAAPVARAVMQAVLLTGGTES